MNSAHGETAVRVQGVYKHFGEGSAKIYALRNAYFDASYGEIKMIVGPSGCGKTTLLSVIAGTLTIDQGEVEVFNTSIYSLSNDEITAFRGQNVGFVFQQFNLIPTLTALENVVIPLLIQRWNKKEAYERSSKILHDVALDSRLDAFPFELSMGQQQRVAIARALVHTPRLLICDEPTASLDGETGRTVMGLLRKIARSPDRCVIVVTHDNRIFEFADHIAQMEDGQIKNVHQD